MCLRQFKQIWMMILPVLLYSSIIICRILCLFSRASMSLGRVTSSLGPEISQGGSGGKDWSSWFNTVGNSVKHYQYEILACILHIFKDVNMLHSHMMCKSTHTQKYLHLQDHHVPPVCGSAPLWRLGSSVGDQQRSHRWACQQAGPLPPPESSQQSASPATHRWETQMSQYK